MSWNHRVVKREFHEHGDWTRYGIHEAFYDQKKKVFAITVDPVEIESDSLDGLLVVIDQMRESVLRTLRGEIVVLDFDKIPEDGADNSVYEGSHD